MAEIQNEGISIVATDPGGNDVTKEMSVLEDTDTAFDPTKVHLDLTKQEKRRTTALLLAIQAYNNIIVKDAEMYLAISRDQRGDEGFKIKPATMSAMVTAALDFDDFISGKLQRELEVAEVSEAPETEEPQD